MNKIKLMFSAVVARIQHNLSFFLQLVMRGEIVLASWRKIGGIIHPYSACNFELEHGKIHHFSTYIVGHGMREEGN